MKTVVLISCVKMKQNKSCKAEELYISPLFKKNLAYARSLGPDKIFILSAKYGLLPLTKKVETYDLALNTFKVKEITKWAENTIVQLKKVTDLEKDRFIFLCGEKYRKYLIPSIRIYETPLKGLDFGKQLQFLNNKIK